VFIYHQNAKNKLIQKITFDKTNKTMTDENQHEITTNHLWQGIPTNLLASQSRTRSELNFRGNSCVCIANVTRSKSDFNRDANVDVRSISGERVQARHYEIPEAIAINGDDNQEQLIVDARPLPWYIRIDFWKLCVIAILIVSVFVVAIVLLSKNLSSSSDINLPIEPHDAPTSFPTYDITIFPSPELLLQPSIQSDKDYIAMQHGVLEQIYTETDDDNSWFRTENWLNDDVSVCKWYGCGCNDMDNKIVTSFNIQSFKSPQEVPTVLGMLSKLEGLHIDGANIVGTLPSELKQMTVVSSMDGILFSKIDNLRHLEYLELRENNFDGQIPSELGLLQSLTYLDISYHEYFTEATIPSEIGYLSSLKTLHMSRNGLSGTLPSELFGLVSLQKMKTAIEMIEGLRYKLRMFGIPVEGPANIYCDNEAVTKNTQVPESTLKKKHHSIAYHRCREAVAAGTVRVAKQGTRKNLADLFTKVLTAARRQFLFRKVHILAIDLNVIVLSLAEGFTHEAALTS